VGVVPGVVEEDHRRKGRTPRTTGRHVPEAEGDPLLGRDPPHEREVALPVLHAVVPHRVRPREAQLDWKRGRGQDVLDDLRHGLVLEDAARRPAPEQRERGDQPEVPRRASPPAGIGAHLVDEALDPALRAAAVTQGQHRVGPEQFGIAPLQLRCGLDHEPEGEQLGDRLPPAEGHNA